MKLGVSPGNCMFSELSPMMKRLWTNYSFISNLSMVLLLQKGSMQRTVPPWYDEKTKFTLRMQQRDSGASFPKGTVLKTPLGMSKLTLKVIRFRLAYSYGSRVREECEKETYKDRPLLPNKSSNRSHSVRFYDFWVAKLCKKILRQFSLEFVKAKDIFF